MAMGKAACLAAIIISAVLISVSVGVQMVQVARAQPRTLVVPTDYSSIQQAISASNDGETIFVKKGTYAESTLNITKTITLTGEDANNTIIRNIDNPPWDFSFPPPSPTTAVQIGADNVKISGFTINDAIVSIAANGDGTQIVGNFLVGSVHLNGNNQLITANAVMASFECSGNSNNITANNFVGSGTGIVLEGSFNKIFGNAVRNSIVPGISVNGDGNTIEENNFADSAGLWIRRGSNNVVTANTGGTLVLLEGFNNTFSANYVANSNYGAIIGAEARSGPAQLLSANNRIFHNNFINNTHQVENDYTVYGTDFWDNGREGNYWSDYIGLDANHDGIGDTPYIIDANRSDHYPLMMPFDIGKNSIVLPTPVPTPTPTFSPSPSPTQQPTIEPTETPTVPPPVPDPPSTYLPMQFIIFIVLVAAAVIGIIIYFKKTK